MGIECMDDVRNHILEKLRDKKKHGRLETFLWRIENDIKEELKSSSGKSFNIKDTWGFWLYNKHDYEHVCHVAINMFKLINQIGRELSTMEEISAYIAALGHDLAMGEPDRDLIDAYCDGIGTADKWRKHHPISGVYFLQRILEGWKGFTNDFDSKIFEIEEIASQHSGEISDINTTDNKAYLIALLRIADLMDAAEDRLPSEDIIAEVIALSSTIGEPFLTSINHYLRRFMIAGVSLQRENNKFPTIELTVKNLLMVDLKTPAGKFGREEIISAKKAFNGILEEFSGELGIPDNWDSIKKTGSLTLPKETNTSNSILKKYGTQINWSINLVGAEVKAHNTIQRWKTKANNRRKYFDKEFHPLEIEKMNNDPYCLFFEPLDFNRFPEILMDTEDEKGKINVSFVVGSGKYKHSDHISWGTDALYIPEITVALKNWAGNSKKNLRVDISLDIDIYDEGDSSRLMNNNLIIIGSGKVNYVAKKLVEIYGENLRIRFTGLTSPEQSIYSGSIRSDHSSYDEEGKGKNMGFISLIQNPWAVKKHKRRVIVFVAGARPVGSIAAMHMLWNFISNTRRRCNNRFANIPAKIVRAIPFKLEEYKRRIPEFDETEGRTQSYIGGIRGYTIIE
jgi:hypothetical protein